MSPRLPRIAKGPQEAAIFAALSTGSETHTQIAERLGCTRQHVSRVASKMRDEIEGAAASTRQAVIDGAVEAKRLAREAGPDIMRTLIGFATAQVPSAAELADLDPETRLAILARLPDVADMTRAGIAVLDRGGVPAKVEADLGGTALEEVAEILRKARSIK